jgi:hypothetical protein
MAGTASDSMTFLSRFFAAGGSQLVRGIAWHSYNMPAELDVTSMATLRSVMAAYGLQSLPNWNTEAGVLEGTWATFGKDRVFAAGYLAKVYLLDWALGVNRLCYYAYNSGIMEGLTLTERETGSVRPNELSPAGLAYINVKNWMQGARVTSARQDTLGVWTVQLQRTVSGTVRSQWVLWSSTGATVSRVLSSTWRVTYRQDLISGTRTSISSTATIQVGDIPVLVGQ